MKRKATPAAPKLLLVELPCGAHYIGVPKHLLGMPGRPGELHYAELAAPKWRQLCHRGDFRKREKLYVKGLG